MPMTSFRIAMAALLLACAPAALAQAVLVPARPVAFEPVVLRLTTDYCGVSPDVIGVAQSQGTISVTTYASGCTEPGVVKALDIRLGSLPQGTYTLAGTHVVEGVSFSLFSSFTFTVASSTVDRVTLPPRRPRAGYAGVWWNPAESGWGLAIQQTPGDTLFAQLYVYGAGNEARWFTFQGGAWTSPTRWEGTVYATTGPGFAQASFDPSRVAASAVGAASLEFAQVPGAEGLATLTYAVNGVTVVKRIQRMPI